MAFSLSLPETNIGVPLVDTYARITFLRCMDSECLIQVSHYANADARRTNAMSVFDITLVAPFAELKPGNDPLAIAYAWLKTQPQYSDAIDC
jgi:hypothetical protein